MLKGKIIIFSIIAATAVSFAGFAFAQTGPSWNLPNVQSPNDLLNNLPAPISDFINSAKQIGDNLYTKSQNLNINSVNPTQWFDSINNWFIGVTGISLAGIIKGIGNLIVWVLSVALDLIKWLLSLIR
jgi:hypothetical protein